MKEFYEGKIFMGGITHGHVFLLHVILGKAFIE